MQQFTKLSLASQDEGRKSVIPGNIESFKHICPLSTQDEKHKGRKENLVIWIEAHKRRGEFEKVHVREGLKRNKI